MPLLNSMGVMRDMTATSSGTSSNQHYMYMFAPGTVASNVSQNDITLGAYDNVQGKYVAVNAQNDQIISFTDSSSVVFNASRPGIYTPWMAARNNQAWFYDATGSGLYYADMSSYTQTTITGTINQVGTQLTKVIIDSTGATIKLGIEFISSVYYISICKFTSSGMVWQKKISHPTGLTTSFFNPVSLCVDSSDNIYFCGGIAGYGVWGRVTSAGALSWLNYQSSLRMAGVTVVGSTLYLTMATTTSPYVNYAWNSNSSTSIPYIAAITASTGTMTKLTWIQYIGGGNPYVLTGVSANPSDPSSVFVYGFTQDPVSGVPDAKIMIFKFNAALTSLTSQRAISFTPNTVANPTYTKNTTYINNLVYQPTSNSYYINGITQDTSSAGYNSGSYYNSFVIRATVDTDYTGTILNRTYNIAPLSGSIALNNASTFTGTSFGTMTTTAYTVSSTTGGISASSSIPTKVNL